MESQQGSPGMCPHSFDSQYSLTRLVMRSQNQRDIGPSSPSLCLELTMRTSTSNNPHEPTALTVGHPKQLSSKSSSRGSPPGHPNTQSTPFHIPSFRDLKMVGPTESSLILAQFFIYRCPGKDTNVLYRTMKSALLLPQSTSKAKNNSEIHPDCV